MGGHRLVLALGLALTCTVAGLAQPVSGPAASPALLPAPKAGAPASFAFATSPLQNPAPLVAGGKAVLAALRKGGYIVYFRHGKTRYDQIGLEQDNIAKGRWLSYDCSTQRNLSDEGRAALKAAGIQFRKARIPLDKSYASHFCRTKDTAAYFVDNAEVLPWLTGGVGVAEPDAYRVEKVSKLLSTRPATGKNSLVFAHGMTLRNLTGFAIEEGHAVVLDPDNLKVVVARIAPDEWAAVAVAQ